MVVNKNVKFIVEEYLQETLQEREFITIKEILAEFDREISMTQEEFRQIITDAIKTQHLKIVGDKTDDDAKIGLGKPFQTEIPENVKIVISRPRLKELSLEALKHRNFMLDTIDCFRELIGKTKKILRICSPFFQSNVYEKDSFPDLKELFTKLL